VDAPLKRDSGNIRVQQVVYQIKIVLLGTRPPIWRRVLVPREFTLAQLHDVVQAAMGWEDCHLHQFYIGNRRFGIPDSNDGLMGESTAINEQKKCLADVLNKVGSKATYVYDFGDSWEHALVVEKILTTEPNVAYPLCTGGKLAGPPEDCGGIPGFHHMLEALADPNHEDHQDMRDWIESFDPEAFSIEALNQTFRKIFRVSRKPKPAQVAQTKSVMARPSTEDLHATLQTIEAALELPHSKQRERIRPDEKVPLELSDRERELIMGHTFADEELTNPLRVVPKAGEPPVFRFTLDDWEELSGFVAFEANHTKDKKLGKELDHLFGRIEDVLDSYADQDD
jgi:hypothetical protein